MLYSDFGSNLLSPKVFCYGSNEANRVLKIPEEFFRKVDDISEIYEKGR